MLTFTSRRDAEAARHRLYAARKSLALICDPLAAQVARYKMTIRPADSHNPDLHYLEIIDFGKIISKALATGAIVPEPPPLEDE